MIYDNPHALAICHYKRDKALCHRDGVKDAPSLDHCVPGCGNIARTDAQAAQLRERAATLETQAQHVPSPSATGSAPRRRSSASRPTSTTEHASPQAGPKDDRRARRARPDRRRDGPHPRRRPRAL
jgi:hypothetical protein